MNYFITLSDQAELDLQETNKYYSELSHELLERFWIDLNSTMERLVKNPLHFQERYQRIRIIFLKNFPFGIHYILNGEEVEVFRILHAKREF
ncbi:MAG: type II toxin-antitoxin system RelE/ParE family toxin [Kaistella sp.]